MVGAGHPEALVLFGSEANHAANVDSDVDFLLIEQREDTPRHRGIK